MSSSVRHWITLAEGLSCTAVEDQRDACCAFCPTLLEAEDGTPPVDYRRYDLKARYDAFNRQLFDGELPDIPVAFKPLKGLGGVVEAMVIRTRAAPSWDKYRGATLKPGTHRLFIDNRFKKTERHIEQMLVHEMIHVYFNHLGDFAENHGVKFQRKARELAARLGFDVPMTEKTEMVELANDAAADKAVAVVLLEKKDGRQAVAILTERVGRENAAAIESRWRDMVRYNYAERATLAIIKSRVWTTLAALLPVQRKADSGMKFHILTQPGAAEDFRQHGEVLFDISKGEQPT